MFVLAGQTLAMVSKRIVYNRKLFTLCRPLLDRRRNIPMCYRLESLTHLTAKSDAQRIGAIDNRTTTKYLYYISFSTKSPASDDTIVVLKKQKRRRILSSSDSSDADEPTKLNKST